MPKPESEVLAEAEALIDAMNAEMQAEFLREFPVHDLTGPPAAELGKNLAAWVAAGRIIALPLPGRIVCPTFQLDATGQPWSLLGPSLAALSPDLTPWQRAFWLVAENEWLNSATPLQAIRNDDVAVLEAAAATRRSAIG